MILLFSNCTPADSSLSKIMGFQTLSEIQVWIVTDDSNRSSDDTIAKQNEDLQGS